MGRIGVFACAGFVVAILPSIPARAASTYVVDLATDQGGACLAGGASSCTLRQAINSANGDAAADTITFSLPAGSTISPSVALPEITEAVTIDGTIAGAPGIELDGTNAGAANGLWVRAPGVTVRGLVVNRFAQAGLAFTDNGGGQLAGGTVQGNYLGTDATGAAALGNGAGVSTGLFFNDVTIGGSMAGQGNLISGNGTGILIAGSDTGTGGTHQIRGNLIGTDLEGLTPVGNGDGIAIGDSLGNTIEENVISGNGLGVRIGGAFALSNVVLGNYIGVGIDGVTSTGNASAGIMVENAATNVAIGGTLPGQGNVIANNSGAGVATLGAAGVHIRANSISSNGLLGIDREGFGGEVTPNDPGDLDGVQNFPELTIPPGGNTVHGALSSTPNASFGVDLFVSAACDSSAHGEGASHVASLTVTTDGDGNATFTSPLAGTPGQAVTATATSEATGDTSEFSECATVIGASATSVAATKTRRRIRAFGAVSPPHPGEVVQLTLRRKRKGEFAVVRSVALVLGGDGGFAARFRRPRARRCRLEAVFDGDADHLPSSASATFRC